MYSNSRFQLHTCTQSRWGVRRYRDWTIHIYHFSLSRHKLGIFLTPTKISNYRCAVYTQYFLFISFMWLDTIIWWVEHAADGQMMMLSFLHFLPCHHDMASSSFAEEPQYCLWNLIYFCNYNGKALSVSEITTLKDDKIDFYNFSQQ